MKGKPRRRRAYRPPKVVSDRIYERYGLACGKSNPMDPNCIKNLMS